MRTRSLRCASLPVLLSLTHIGVYKQFLCKAYASMVSVFGDLSSVIYNLRAIHNNETNRGSHARNETRHC